LRVPVLDLLPVSGAGLLAPLKTSVLFAWVTPGLHLFHYGPDLASWSFGPDDAFYLAAAFRVTYC
jgi:hypothetical protein